MAKTSAAKITRLTRDVNTELQLRGIRHAVYIEQLKNKTAQDVVGFLNKNVLPDVIESLESRLRKIAKRGYDTSTYTTHRLREMVATINGEVRGGLASLGKLLIKDLRSIALAEAEFQVTLLQRVIPFEIDLLSPSPATLRSIVTSRPFEGKVLKDWFADLSGTTQKRVSQQINIGIARGEAIPQITKRIAGDGGVLATTKHGAQAVARTAVNHVTTHAREETYKENSNVVDRVRFVATLDTRTTEICMSLDGQVFPIDEGPRPPMHMSCRSTTVPVTKSWEELGIKGLKNINPSSRASMNGQVPAKETYGSWLKQQPDKVQNEALGPARAELFRSGKLDVKDFVNDQGKTMSLKELRKREGLSE